MKKFSWLSSAFIFLPFLALWAQAGSRSTKAVIITDEAEAVLNILAKETNAIEIKDSDWQKLFSSEGYLRLKKREHSMGRKFDDSTFRRFVLSEDLKSRYTSLGSALEKWKKTDIGLAAGQALKYLPENAVIKAKIYPVIKPAKNSFVFETDSDPAIFMYINPEVRPEKLFNTLSHELHHIGLSPACGQEPGDTTVIKGVKDALRWISGFSEGRAVLAATGSPEIHPHAVSDPPEKSVWDRDFKNAGQDMKELEDFFQKLIDGSIPEKDIVSEGMRFVFRENIPQGAFYTVGWLMASTVEKVLGRERLVASTCDGYMFLRDYNRAAKELNSKGSALPLWSEKLLSQIKNSKSGVQSSGL